MDTTTVMDFDASKGSSEQSLGFIGHEKLLGKFEREAAHVMGI
jgi:hypothetical protein